MLKEILDYQKKDAERIKLEMELENSKEKKAVNSRVNIIRESQDKMLELDARASRFIEEFNNLENEYNKLCAEVEKRNKIDLESLNEEEVRAFSKENNKGIAALLTLSKKISAYSKDIIATLSLFDKTHSNARKMRAEYDQVLARFNSYATENMKLIDKINTELHALGEKVPQKFFGIYQKKRSDHIFPVFVPEINNSCGGCAMNLPQAKQDQLIANGIIECENCHRIIYKPKE